MASGYEMDEKSPLMQAHGMPQNSAYKPTLILLADDGLSKYQAYSGIALSTFTALHMFNHVIGALGDKIDYHRDWMQFFRQYYQNPLVECGLGVSLVVHSYCSMKKKYQRYNKKSMSLQSIPQSLQWHRNAGTLLGVTILGHVAVTRLIPLFKFGREKAKLIDITEITFAGNVEGKGMALYPFLAVMFTAGFYHTIFGLNQSAWILRKKRAISQSNSKFWTVLAITGAIGGTVAVAAAAGKFFDIEISQPEMFKQLFQ